MDGRYSVFSRVTKKTYIIGKNEYLILSNLNGINNSEDLSRLSNVYTKEMVEKLLVQFEKLGFIKGNEGKRKQSIFRFSWDLINPNKLIKENAVLTKVLSKFIIWCSWILFMLGLALALSFGDKIRTDLIEGIRKPSALVVIPVFLVVLFLHECGHALIARYYGVNVPEMGIVLYFFMPGAYVNLTAVNLLKNKKKRVLIYLGGILVNATLAGFGFILYSFVKYGKTFFLWFAFENLLYIVMNLFVYIKMDGYLLLQEMLDIQGIAEKSYSLLSQDVKKKISGFIEDSPYKIIKVQNEREGTEEFFSRAVLKSYSIVMVLFMPMIFLSILLSIC